MSSLSTEQKAKLVEFHILTNSVIVTQRKFRNFFNLREAPTRKTIVRLTNKFKKEGTVLDLKVGKCGRKRSALRPENVGKVAERVQNNPKTCLRHLSQQVGISKTSTHRIVRRELKLKSYKFPISHQLTTVDCNRRKDFCNWFLEKCADCPLFLSNIWWSDEAHFHLHGLVNRQNFRFWGDSPPEDVLQVPLHSAKVTVWCALSAQGVIGPYFFEDDAGATVTVNAKRYKEVLQRFWRALQTKCPDTLTSQWFQQDGAPPHTARDTLAWLDLRMESRLISKGAAVEWPAHSPDLSPLDFYLWGYLKSRVYSQSPQDVTQLRTAITTAIRQISSDTYARVAEEAKRRAIICASKNGSHLEHVLG